MPVQARYTGGAAGREVGEEETAVSKRAPFDIGKAITKVFNAGALPTTIIIGQRRDGKLVVLERRPSSRRKPRRRRR